MSTRIQLNANKLNTNRPFSIPVGERFAPEPRTPLNPELIVNGGFREAHIYNAITGLLEDGQVPVAIIAANNHMAVAAMRAGQTFCLRVPEDVCIVQLRQLSIETEGQLSSSDKYCQIRCELSQLRPCIILSVATRLFYVPVDNQHHRSPIGFIPESGLDRWEPGERRRSRRVLREAAGVVPAAYSPKFF